MTSGRGGLVGAHDFPQIFGGSSWLESAVDLTRSQNSTVSRLVFGLRSGVVGGELCPLRCLGRRQGWMVPRTAAAGEGRGRVQVASLDYTTPRIIDYMGLRVEEFVLQGSELRVIECKWSWKAR